MANGTFVAAALTAFAGEIARQVLTAWAARTRARRSTGITTYQVTLVGRFIIDAAIVIMGGLAVVVLYNGDSAWIAAMMGGFTALCVFAYPGPIVVDPASGLRTRRWYGAAVRIAWHEVAELKNQDQVGQTTVISVSGRQIVHTSLHADSAGFRHDVQRYARLTPRLSPQ
jgi:hypothetical protein